VAAFTTFAGGVVFKKFNRAAAFRAPGFKNCPGLPVLGILTWTFQCFFLWWIKADPIKLLIMVLI
jgi:hypothetical protein